MIKKKVFLIIIVVLIVAGGAFYWFGLRKSAEAPMPKEVKVLLEKLQKHIILPTDEDPQISIIDDPVQATKDQPFVTGSQKGDLLIVYIKARKAIVYSPSRDIIINVGPISVNPDEVSPTAPSSTASTTETTKKSN